MGWDYCHATHYKNNGTVDRKAECDEQFNHGNYKVLKSSMVGTVYYAAVQHSDEVFAVIALTAGKDRNDPYFNFGMKSMCDSSGPCECRCPKGILDLLTPTDDEYANKWRERCRDNHAKKKQKSWLQDVPIGGEVIYKDHKGKERIITKHAPAFQFKTWFWFDGNQYQYIPKKYVTEDRCRKKEVSHDNI